MKNIEQSFSDRSEIREILSRGDTNKHVSHLISSLSGEDVSTAKLFEYGMQNLPDDSNRPDNDLKEYFLLLSEMKECSKPLCSAALDAMIYCENTSDFPTMSRQDILEQYKKIAPLL